MSTLGKLTVPKIDQSGPPQTGEFIYVDISSIDNKLKRIVEPKRLPVSAAPSRARQRLQPGDVLVSMTRPNLNAVAIVPPDLKEAVASSGFHVLRAVDGIEPRWLFYAVHTHAFIEAMSSLVQGALYPAVRPKDISGFGIDAPLLEEQQHIVAEIEKQFSRLDEAIASIKRVKANLKRYKAAVLKAAVEGKLTEEWRKQHPSVEPASKLLERILVERRAKWNGKYKEPVEPDMSDLPKLPDGWLWVRMDTACSKVQDGTHFSPKEQSATGAYKYITAKNIKTWGLDLSEITYVPIHIHREIFGRCNPEKGDVLLIKDGVTTGIATVNPLDEEFSLLSSVALLKPLRSSLDSHFVKHWLNSPSGYRATMGRMTGSAIKRIILEKIKEAPIPVPPLTEQRLIVAEVERRLSVIVELEATVEANLTRADHLRQSVLGQAFSGRLLGRDTKHIPDILPTVSIAAESHARYGRDGRARR